MYPYFFLPSSQCRVCIIAGNISPIDVITHVPILCEDKDIPYVYVSSKEVSNNFALNLDAFYRLVNTIDRLFPSSLFRIRKICCHIFSYTYSLRLILCHK